MGDVGSARYEPSLLPPCPTIRVLSYSNYQRSTHSISSSSYYNSSSACLCVPYFLRGPLTDLRQTWWVYVGWPPICPWGVLFRKGQRVDGSTGHFRFPLYYICASLTPHAAKGSFCFAGSAAESNSAPFAALHLNGVCRWTSQLLLRGSFSKRSTGRRVNGSNGSTAQRVTFTFTILYMIADDARLTPPRCKKHMAYDDTRLTPHRCKKHTASFAPSTGKFPSLSEISEI